MKTQCKDGNLLDLNPHYNKFMAHKKKKINTVGRGMTDYRPSTQAEPEKVTIMVGTFLKEGGFQQVVSESAKVPATKKAQKKVTCTVGTFFKKESVKVPATKKEAKKGGRYGDHLFE
ncbi:hypothetical protein [Emticicia sp. C21]|uniref:hypothetical protein n=1 Tax=Emticicia sp. C21 TaxID=2302915 RepID=UPI000E98034C|nr:hypothetical protein [Emticicia sp. C21]RFS18287.1 hypothetical protein D0T08_03295 [Emticicia sp. C21]